MLSINENSGSNGGVAAPRPPGCLRIVLMVALSVIVILLILILIGWFALNRWGSTHNECPSLGGFESNPLFTPDFSPEWTLDGKRVVIRHEWRIFSMGVDVWNVESMPKEECISDHWHDLSPVNDHLVYITDRYWRGDRGSYRYTEIEASDLQGTNRRTLTNNSAMNVAPSWSPNGNYVAFVAVSYNSRILEGIHIVGGDGTEQRNVAGLASLGLRDDTVGQSIEFGQTEGPVWSPDSKHLAFVITVTGQEGKQLLYVVRVDDSSVKKLAEVNMGAQSEVGLSTPSWSPDGQYMAFAMNSGDESGAGVYIIGLDGSDLMRILDKDAFQVLWSPNGSEILAMTSEGGYIAHSDGTGLRRVIPSHLSGLASWSPDGSRIAVYGRGDYADSEILYVVSRDGTAPRLLGKGVGYEGDFVAPSAARQGLSSDEEAGYLQTCSSTGPVPEPRASRGLVIDCESLLALRHALAGDNDLNWTEDSLITEWAGVGISGSPLRVRGLGLGDIIHLPVTLTPELDRLTELEWIRMGGNSRVRQIRLTGEIPKEIGNLKVLQSLSIVGQFLTGNIPAELGELKFLVWLDLSRNMLTGAIPPEIAGAPNLQRLNLSHNRLHESIPPEWGRGLRELNLSYNELSGVIPPELGNLNSLEYLNLANNSLSGSVPTQLEGMRGLKRLDLSGNSLSGCIHADLPEIWVEESGLERCEPLAEIHP